jgi:hypothetical protein
VLSSTRCRSRTCKRHARGVRRVKWVIAQITRVTIDLDVVSTEFSFDHCIPALNTSFDIISCSSGDNDHDFTTNRRPASRILRCLVWRHELICSRKARGRDCQAMSLILCSLSASYICVCCLHVIRISRHMTFIPFTSHHNHGSSSGRPVRAVFQLAS